MKVHDSDDPCAKSTFCLTLGRTIESKFQMQSSYFLIILKYYIKNGTIAGHFEVWFPSVTKGIILVHDPLLQALFSNTFSISFDP